MATTYNKAKFDKLKMQIVEKVYQYGKEHDSCDPEMINFISDALGIASSTAEKMFNEVKKRDSKTYTLTVRFTVPNGEQLAPVRDSYDITDAVRCAVMGSGSDEGFDPYDMDIQDASITLVGVS